MGSNQMALQAETEYVTVAKEDWEAWHEHLD
jgi:hypothetical protein